MGEIILGILKWIVIWPFVAIAGVWEFMVDDNTENEFLQFIKCFFMGIVIGLLVVVIAFYILVALILVETFIPGKQLMEKGIDFSFSINFLFIHEMEANVPSLIMCLAPTLAIIISWIYGIYSTSSLGKENAASYARARHSEIKEWRDKIEKKYWEVKRQHSVLSMVTAVEFTCNSVKDKADKLIEQGKPLMQEIEDDLKIRHFEFEEPSSSETNEKTGKE